MKLLIITTDPKTLKWKSRWSKIGMIRNALNLTPNATWDVSIEYRDLKPEVVNGRVTHDWFNSVSYPLFEQGYHHVYLHFSMKRWKELGIESDIRGSNQNDTDFVGESYGRGDEHTLRGKTKQNQFVQNVLHEMSHELARATGVADMTHVWHAEQSDISGIFRMYDMNNWQPAYVEQLRAKISIMQKIIQLMKRPVDTIFHPVQFTPRLITQRYGKLNNSYPRTGRHIGTDYSMSIGTPLHAPALGKVTAAGTGKATGNYCHFEYSFQGEIYEERWCHLREVPRLGTYARGTIVARSGNTGQSTGPHLHREVWRRDVRVDLINAENWDELTLDPETLI